LQSIGIENRPHLRDLFKEFFPLLPSLMKKSFLIGVLLSMALVGPGYSAVLTGSVNIDPPLGVNLTTSGSLDWAIWNTTSSTALSERAPTNTKSDGAGLIGDISGLGGSSGSVRGYGGAEQTYSYTDGVSPETLTDSTQGFVGNATLDSVGAGVTLTIVGDPFQPLRVDIWTTGFRATGELTASLEGAANVVLLSSYEADKVPALFSFVFQPDEISDVLTISYIMTVDAGTSAHVGIQAIAVSAVPEPSAALLLAGGLIAVVVFRRRGQAGNF
jgi:hypothetical protein